MKKPHHPIHNLGAYAHPKKASAHSLVSPKQANPRGPMHAQVGDVKPRMPSMLGHPKHRKR